MPYVLLSVSGHDRPGIVRDVAEALLHLDANIEDSSMTALRGRFAMMLIVRLPEQAGLGGLKGALAELEQRTGLTIQSQPISDEEAQTESGEPDCVVMVHMMALEVNTGEHGDEMRDRLKAVASRLNVDIAVHDIDEAVL
jgi:glycine cleavage system transcriptional repressor